MLVLVATAIYFGVLEAVVGYPRTLPGDVVVGEAGASAALLHTSSRLPAGAVRDLRKLPGVAAVQPLYGRLVWLKVHDRQALVFLVEIDRDDPFGAPVAVLEGRARPQLNEILVDRVLAHDLRLAVGDAVPFGNGFLRVGGITTGGNAILATYAFVARGVLLLGGTQLPSFAFVQPETGVDRDALVGTISTRAGLQAYRREDFLEENRAITRQVVLPLILILVVLSAAVGGSIVGLTLYAAAIERREEYGLLKALGVPRRTVLGVVVLESGIATGMGVIGGIVAGYLLAAGIAIVEPRFVTAVPGWLPPALVMGGMVVGLLAAVSPVRAVARIDPGLVFRV
jgi:putative ABC transport system permease protein